MMLAASVTGAADRYGPIDEARAGWLADKRTDPLDIAIEAEADRARMQAASGDCEAALMSAATVLAANPFQLGALDVQARCGPPELAREAAARRDAILAVIERSGSGAGVFDMWQVISWTEPFEFLRLKGLEPETFQIGCGRTEHLIVTARAPDGTVDRYYFDIHEPYRACRTRGSCQLEDRNIPCAIAPR